MAALIQAGTILRRDGSEAWLSGDGGQGACILPFVLLCGCVVVLYVWEEMPDSLLIASEDSRDWQRTRVHGARSRQGGIQGPMTGQD